MKYIIDEIWDFGPSAEERTQLLRAQGAEVLRASESRYGYGPGRTWERTVTYRCGRRRAYALGCTPEDLRAVRQTGKTVSLRGRGGLVTSISLGSRS